MINIRKLESELWESADLLRAGSKLTSNQYCMPVLGLIFLRYAYSRFKLVETEILKNRPSRGGRVLPIEASDFAAKSALYLPKEAQYEYLLNLPEDISVAGLKDKDDNDMKSLGEVVNNAMSLIEEQSEQLTGVLPNSYTDFSDEILSELLRIFNNSALDEVGGDVIGRIYEYFLNKFAKNIASDDGVFFTPKSLVKMIVNIIEPERGILLDPACGSGGMFIQSGDFVNAMGMNANSAMTFYGQEKVEYNAKLCLMNMAVHGLTGVIKSGDEANSFYHDAHNLNGCCDYVMANPPFNVDKVKSETCENAGRLPFGMPGINKSKEVGNANYLWISYFYSYLNEKGRAGFVMASSATDSQGKDNPEITEQILDAIEAADLDVDQQDKLEEEFAKEIHLLIAEPRLESIARDFVNHYSDLWTSGKAMFVCLNKVTCVRMYNYVQEYWAKEIEVLESKIKNASQQEAQELRRKLKWMQETEMAVVISQEQNEIQTFKEWHLDIKPHREKMEKRELDKEFKDSKNPLRIVFVCAMWLTGFDVKCLSCLYLDKPLKAHTLMQAIARANRVNEGKSNGLIIDYIGIVKALRKALADYTANVSGISGTDPTIDKKELISRITDTIGKAKIFLAEHDFDLESLIVAVGFAKLSYLQEAANAVCGTIENKKTYSTYASELNRLMKYIDRADITEHTRKQYEAIAAIYAELQKKRKHVNTTNLMIEINSIISSYIEIQHMPITSNQETRRFDISAIDFGLLRTEFAKVKRKNLVMRDLEEIIQQKLDRMLFTNPERINYYERYQQIIMGYNAEQDRATIEKTFMDLMDLANQMNQEEQRYAREGFSSDEELSLYDMLFRDDLSKNDIKKLKEVATTLLRKIKNRIAEIDHWTDKQETKAEIDNLIRNILYDELPLCYDEISISTYRQRIYEYVYTRYKSVA